MDWTCISCVRRRILNYWMTKEVPILNTLNYSHAKITLLNSEMIYMNLWLWVWFTFFFFKFICLAALRLHCCVRAFSSFSEGGYSSLWCMGFSLQWLLLLPPHIPGLAGLVVMAHGLSCPDALWHLPRPGIKPMSPALAGRFLTTGPPEEAQSKQIYAMWMRQ